MKNLKPISDCEPIRTILIRAPYRDHLVEVSADRETRRHTTFVSGPTRVDQSIAAESDINNVILRYTQTGQLPIRANNGSPIFADVSEVPTLVEALQAVRNADAALQAAMAASQAQRATNPKPETPAPTTPGAALPAPPASSGGAGGV